MHGAMILAPHAARLRALMAAGLQGHALLIVAALVVLCACAAVAVRLEVSR